VAIVPPALGQIPGFGRHVFCRLCLSRCQIRALRGEFQIEFGAPSKTAAALLGPLLLWSSRREEKRLARGKTYEPKPIVERRNWVAF